MGRYNVLSALRFHRHQVLYTSLFGLGSNGCIWKNKKSEGKNRTRKWRNGDLVVMVLDTLNGMVTFDVSLKVVSRKMKFECPLRVGFWMSDQHEITSCTRVEVIDGLCVTRKVQSRSSDLSESSDLLLKFP